MCSYSIDYGFQSIVAEAMFAHFVDHFAQFPDVDAEALPDAPGFEWEETWLHKPGFPVFYPVISSPPQRHLLRLGLARCGGGLWQSVMVCHTALSVCVTMMAVTGQIDNPDRASRRSSRCVPPLPGVCM
jgi:hypothetical protein